MVHIPIPKNLRVFLPSFICIVVAIGFVFAMSDREKQLEQRAHAILARCDDLAQDDARIDCWYEVIREEFRRGGPAQAFAIFSVLYESSDLFIETGCHRHAHRVGDVAYYESYLLHKDMDKMEFPAITKSCGYGFFHGFLEHLIQDNPDPAFVDETCAYFDKRLSAAMPAMRITCYHGSGHGFSLAGAQAAQFDKSKWGNPQEFVDEPARLCERLTQATPYEKEECLEGIFNVLVEWMTDHEYGLSYNEDDPFALCREQRDSYKEACYYEMAQKLDSVSGFSVVRAGEIAARIPDERFAKTVMAVAVAGMMQRGLTLDSQYEYAVACRSVDEALRDTCFHAIIGGMMEHGNPGKEYKKIAEFCSFDALTDEEERACGGALLNGLKRFYTDAQIAQFCRESSSAFRNLCSTSGIVGV